MKKESIRVNLQPTSIFENLSEISILEVNGEFDQISFNLVNGYIQFDNLKTVKEIHTLFTEILDYFKKGENE